MILTERERRERELREDIEQNCVPKCKDGLHAFEPNDNDPDDYRIGYPEVMHSIMQR